MSDPASVQQPNRPAKTKTQPTVDDRLRYLSYFFTLVLQFRIPSSLHHQQGFHLPRLLEQSGHRRRRGLSERRRRMQRQDSSRPGRRRSVRRKLELRTSPCHIRLVQQSRKSSGRQSDRSHRWLSNFLRKAFQCWRKHCWCCRCRWKDCRRWFDLRNSGQQ